ncbi:hypothetical protein M885DRAFT_257023 [Pelagophyceae sp. CCMP2097]|nr:hypothetical protein M885DRAFT_257023 [Pelagophyceae sp. CCMP2097]
MEYMRTSGPLAESIRDFVVADDDEAIRRAEALGGSGGGGDLVQLALRARGRVCLDAVERREATARSGKRYGFVMRLRPDYAFDCRLPPMGAAWAALPRAWAAHHRDYWEVMSRPAADVGFKWLWEEAAGLEMCRNKGALTEPGTRVESCLYFALCSRGVAVSAADEYITERGAKNRDKRRAVAVARSAAAKRGVPLPPLLPGIIIRPCCDAAAAHGSFFKELPTATCALERAPVLGAWFLAGFEADGTAAWRAARQRAVKLLRPACNETLADDVPPKSGDDDDDDFAAAPPPPPALVDEDDVPAWALPPARKDEGGGEDGGGDDDDDGRADADARPAADDDDDDDGARTAERSELRR